MKANRSGRRRSLAILLFVTTLGLLASVGGCGDGDAGDAGGSGEVGKADHLGGTGGTVEPLNAAARDLIIYELHVRAANACRPETCGAVCEDIPRLVQEEHGQLVPARGLEAGDDLPERSSLLHAEASTRAPGVRDPDQLIQGLVGDVLAQAGGRRIEILAEKLRQGAPRDGGLLRSLHLAPGLWNPRRVLGDVLDLRPGMRVLDLGCGKVTAQRTDEEAIDFYDPALGARVGVDT